MISVDEARARIFAALQPVGAETIPLAAGFGRVLASPVTARLTQPPADVSAMDGFALRAAEGAAGAVLRIIGAAPAGHPYAGSVGAGEAVRLFTGSFVPEGADTILRQENAWVMGNRLTVTVACGPGRHIRRAGQDFHLGETLLTAGRRLSARDIGLAAAGNHPWLDVHRRPRIAILTTGDEIALPGEAIPAGGIISSNAPALAAFVSAAGGEPVVISNAGDDIHSIAGAAAAARGADLLITTGGASVGDHDLVKPALEKLGLTLDFWKIAMRPGKPLMFGRLGGLPVLGLPGNPVSAFVCAVLFLRPAIDVLAGLPAAAPVFTKARLGAALKENDEREDFLRASLADGVATAFPVQDSGMLKSLARANALIRRRPHAAACQAGAEIEVIALDDS